MSLIELEKKAIERLKCFEPDDGYYLCYSGGKDGDVIRILAILANVKHENHHSLTTVDAPETIDYIKSIKDIIIENPPLIELDGKLVPATMWRLIEKHMAPPTRLARYCCSELKEKGGKGKVKITGVRWDESNNRKNNSDLIKIIGRTKSVQKTALKIGADYKVTKQGGLILNHDNDINRRMVEHCYRTTSTMVNPIIDWTDDDVWKFLNFYGCKSNPLYECGYSRVGCIGCPMADGQRINHFAKYPIYKKNYIKAFDKMITRRKKLGKPVDEMWQDGEHVMAWWLQEDINQTSLFEEENQ